MGEGRRKTRGRCIWKVLPEKGSSRLGCLPLRWRVRQNTEVCLGPGLSRRPQQGELKSEGALGVGETVRGLHRMRQDGLYFSLSMVHSFHYSIIYAFLFVYVKYPIIMLLNFFKMGGWGWR